MTMWRIKGLRPGGIQATAARRCRRHASTRWHSSRASGALADACGTWREHEVEVQRVVRHRAGAPVGRHTGRVLYPVGDQRRSHAEDRVGIEEAVAFPEHMRYQPLVAWRIDHEMHMRRSPWMATEGLQ